MNVYGFEFCSALWKMGTSITYYFMPFFYQKVLWEMLTSVLLSRRVHIRNVSFQTPWNLFFYTEMGSRALFCASFKLWKSGFLFRFLSEDAITSNKNLNKSVFNIHTECFSLLKQITFILVELDGKQFSYITSSHRFQNFVALHKKKYEAFKFPSTNVLLLSIKLRLQLILWLKDYWSVCNPKLSIL